jgi:hypothetical protein
VAVVAEPEQQLAWEARQRPRAAIAAVVAGVLTLAGYLWAGLGLRDTPPAGFLESLANAFEPGPVGTQPSVKRGIFAYYDEHAITIIGSAVVRAIALLALGWAITFLAAATRARRPEVLRLVVYLPLIGAALAALSTVAGAVGTISAISDFLDGPRTVDAARDVGGGSLLITAEILGQIGPLALVAGLFLVTLNAMRVGLLTRFLGFLGIISAVLTILPLMPLPVVQSFWLVGTGLLMLGLVRGGLPPAWRTGRPEPWPTSMEAAQRRRAAEDRKQGIVRPEPEPEPAPAGGAHPSSKKRKRKRRD